jgi:FAD/FMN-containing dehydrogenase
MIYLQQNPNDESGEAIDIFDYAGAWTGTCHIDTFWNMGDDNKVWQLLDKGHRVGVKVQVDFQWEVDSGLYRSEFTPLDYAEMTQEHVR